MATKNKNIWVYGALLGALLCWSSVPLFLKYFTTRLDAWTVNGVRYGFAALLLLPAALHYQRQPLAGRCIWRDALVPALVNVLGQVGWALAPYYLDASVMGFGVRSAFFFTLLASLWLLPEERYLARTPLFWVGSVICLVGLTALFAGSLGRGRATLTGVVILLLTAIVWGGYGVAVRKWMRGYAPHHSFGVICLYTAAVLAFLMPLGRPSTLLALPAWPLTLLLLSAALGIASAHIFMYHVIQRLGPVMQSGGEFVTPFLTFLGAAWLFGERLTPWQWCGGLGVIGGSLLMLRAHRGPAAEPAAPGRTT